jgi:putative DNA primase/helicase
MLGWRPHLSGFVLADSVIGSENSIRRPMPPLWLSNRHLLRFRTRGTSESWWEEVGKLAGFSSACILSIGSAFAAPLLHVTGHPSFGINLYGRSKAGKTTALMVGASIEGIGREQDLQNWGATASAKGETARVYNDMILPLNEVGLLGGSKRAAYAAIRETIYRLCEGSERLKNTQSRYATLAATSEFRTIFFSTAEHSFDEYARLAGDQRDEGEYARCLDVPINRVRERTIVDRFPKRIVGKRRRRWAENLVIRMRGACEKNHGAVFRRYIEYLIREREGLLERIRDLMATFRAHPQHPEGRGAFEHAARNFALLYAACRLAKGADIVRWSDDRITEAFMRCLRRAPNSTGDGESMLSAAKRELQALLSSDRIVARAAYARAADTPIGYFEDVAGVRTYTLHSRQLRNMFKAHPRRFDALIDWLFKEGYPQPKRSKGTRPGPDWAEQARRWPDGRPVRSIVFFDPFRKK